MNRTVGYLIPIVILLAFVVLMNSGNVLKKPMSVNDNVEKQIETLKNDLVAENWNKASKDTEELKRTWKKISARTQFSVERDELLGFEKNLARISYLILGKDKKGALAELGEAKKHYEDLGK